MVILHWLAVLLLFLLICRFVRLNRGPPAPAQRGGDAPLNVCVVLGSGGHTSEMMRAIKTLSPDPWRATRPFYVVSATDTHSAAQAAEFEKNYFQRQCPFYTVPRAREVGQSYFLSIFSTLWAFWSSLRLIILEKPEVMLVNGPGVCVPVVTAALLVALFSPPRYYSRPAIVFMESYTCVKHMSLSGKLLAPFCDVCIVYWKTLYDACGRRWWGKKGSLFWVGTVRGSKDTQPLMDRNLTDAQRANNEPFALVTVGSTQFNSLIEAMDSEVIFRALAKRGITRLLVQKGTSSYQMRLSSAHGVTVEVFAYRPRLHEVLRDAALIISHAGAGTILEALEYKRPLIVVPNRALMSDHQLELAEALSAERYLFCVQLGDICSQLQSLDFNTLWAFPGLDTAALRDKLQPIFALGRFCDASRKKR